MADPFATIDDVETLFGSKLDSETTILAERLLRMAASLMRAKVATIDARIAAYNPNARPPTGLDPEVASDVNAAMVVRVLRNPEGATSEAVGPASVTYSPQVASGYLFLTQDELLLIAKPTKPSIGSVRTEPGLAPKVRPFGWPGPVFDQPRRNW